MRLVLLTGLGIEHRYLIQRFAHEFGSDLKAVVISDGVRPLPQRIRTYVRRYTMPQLASRVWAKSYRRLTRAAQLQEATRCRFLTPLADPLTLVESGLLRTVPSHNGPECLALLGEIKPDIIAIYGTAMIKAPVIRLSGRCGLNMHTGISPRYRGSDTIFWPLHNEEPEWVGVTVHVLDEGIDAGPIAAIGRPQIEANDDEESLFSKAVIVGSELYVTAIRSVMSGSLAPVPQDHSLGREYRFVDRTVAAERRVKKLLRDGLLRRFAMREP